MIQINNPADCCGCSACASVCAHGAITMKPDALGFLYPVVDTGKCTGCGLCEKVCAFHDDYDRSLNLLQPTAYGARHKEIKEVENSHYSAEPQILFAHIPPGPRPPSLLYQPPGVGGS